VLELMALADGELAGEEKVRAERVVAESEEAQRLVEGFRRGHIAEWLRADAAERAPQAEGIADAVMAKVARESPPEGAVRAIAIARRRPARPGLAPAAFAALALAAGVALLVQGGNPGESNAPVATGPVISSPAGPLALSPPREELPAAVATHERATLGVEVDDIDSPSRDVTVFEIPVGAAAAAAARPSSVVIMIEDDPGAK
jgi:hypothetical protein